MPSDTAEVALRLQAPAFHFAVCYLVPAKTVAGTSSERAFDALSNARRRQLLLSLLEHDPQTDVPIPEAADTDENEQEPLRMELYHSHLPHLDADGFSEWNREAHTVSRGPNFGEIRPLLELLDRHRDQLSDDRF